MGGETASTIVEFTNPPQKFIEKEPTDLFFMNLDSIENWERYYFKVQFFFLYIYIFIYYLFIYLFIYL